MLTACIRFSAACAAAVRGSDGAGLGLVEGAVLAAPEPSKVCPPSCTDDFEQIEPICEKDVSQDFAVHVTTHNQHWILLSLEIIHHLIELHIQGSVKNHRYEEHVHTLLGRCLDDRHSSQIEIVLGDRQVPVFEESKAEAQVNAYPHSTMYSTHFPPSTLVSPIPWKFTGEPRSQHTVLDSSTEK
jgi:hypothetical protein